VGGKEGQEVMDTEGTLHITEGKSSVMESGTSTGMDEGITVVTLGEIEAGTKEETEIETSCRPDRALIRCKAAAPT